MIQSLLRRGLCIAALVCSFAAWAEETYRLDIAPQPLAKALQRFAEQSGLQIVYYTKIAQGQAAGRVVGTLSASEALRQLLSGTDLIFQAVNADTIAIRASGSSSAVVDTAAMRLAHAEAATKGAEQSVVEESSRKAVEHGSEPKAETIPEILVTGAKVLNMDIKRTREDPQPYVVFDRQTLMQSGASNLEAFLKQRLPMNTQAGASELSPTFNVEGSQINLRGLGTNQTLILVDGRRLPQRIDRVTPTQPDINGLPLAAIERVEVLPSTASGIYGGNAIGGAINIILRRDYSGVEVGTQYENTFQGDAAVRRVDLSYGANFNDGRSSLLLGGSYTDRNPQKLSEIGVIQRGIARILQNNPSTLLGAATPPLGRTANLRSVSGANLTLKTTGQSLGSYYTYLPEGYVGGDGGAALVANAGRYNFELSRTAQYRGGESAVSSNPTVKSVLASFRHHLTSRLQVFADGGASNTESSHPYLSWGGSFTVPQTVASNPFNESIRVTVPLYVPSGSDLHYRANSDRRLAGGLIFQLPAGWTTTLDYNWVHAESKFRSSPSTANPVTAASATPVSNGTINVLRDLQQFPVDWSPYLVPNFYTFNPFETNTRETSGRISGPLMTLPAGKVTLSTLLQHRRDTFGDTYASSGGNNLRYPDRSQQIKSAYMELGVPLLANPATGAVVRQWDLQIAGRYDDHTTHGSTGLVTNGVGEVVRTTNNTQSFNPTFAMKMALCSQLTLRGSYGRGFRAPAVNELNTSPLGTNPITSGSDPLRGGTAPGPYFNQQGGNPDLKPERSTALSVGAIFTPAVLPNARLSVDWTRIKKTNDISTLNNQQVIDNEAILPGRVTRGPRLPTDPAGWAGPITQINTTLANLARSEIEAYDVQFDYSWPTARFGQIDLFAVATWQTHYLTQIISTAPVVENVGIGADSPLRFKGNAGLTWKYRQWTVGWFTSYFDSYLTSTDANTRLTQGDNGYVPSQMYHDVMVELPLGAGEGSAATWLQRLTADTTVQFGVKNVFDKTPPYDAFTLFYYSPFGDPRGARYYANLRRQF